MSASQIKAFYTIIIVDKRGRQIGQAGLEPLKRKDAYKRLLSHLKSLENDEIVAGGYLHFERFA